MTNCCDEFLMEIDRRLDLPLDKRISVMRELVSHYHEIRDELVESGMELTQADEEAIRRLGSPSDIATRLNAAHNSASWKSALLAAMPFFAWGICLLVQSDRARTLLEIVLGALLLCGSIRELVCRRRPIWLATWLGGAWIAVIALIAHLWPNQCILITVNFLYAVVLVTVWPSRVWRWKGIGYVLVAAGGLWLIVLLAHYHVRPANDGMRTAVGVSGYLACCLATIGSIQVFAMRVFGDRRSGNTAAASLFLFSVFAGLYVALDFHARVLPVAGVSLMGLMIIAFAISRTWGGKAAWLASAVVLTQILLLTIGRSFDAGAGTQSLVSAENLQFLMILLLLSLVACVCILGPMLGERSEQKNRPAIVR